MVKSPAFQWYPKDYLTSERVATMDLKTEGAYRRAIDFCWLHGSIPADEKKLALLIGKGCTVAIAKEIKEMFVADNKNPDRLLHQRLEEERRKQESFREKQKENGAKGGRPKKEQKIVNEDVNEDEEKGLGFFSETQTITKKSPSISNLQSSISNLHIPSSDIKEGEINSPPTPDEFFSNETVEEPQEKEKKVATKKRKVFEPPNLEDVTTQFQLLKGREWDVGKINIEAKKFIAFYESKGWMVGKNKMVNWRASVAGWVNRQTETNVNRQDEYEQQRAANRTAFFGGSGKFDS